MAEVSTLTTNCLLGSGWMKTGAVDNVCNFSDAMSASDNQLKLTLTVVSFVRGDAILL